MLGTRKTLIRTRFIRGAAHSPEARYSFGSIEPASPQALTVYGGWERRLQQMQARQQPVAAPENDSSKQLPGIHWGSGRIDLAQLLSRGSTTLQPSNEQSSVVKPLSAEASSEGHGTSLSPQALLAASSDAITSSLPEDASPRDFELDAISVPERGLHQDDVSIEKNSRIETTGAPILRIDAPHFTPPSPRSNEGLIQPVVKQTPGSQTQYRHQRITPAVAPELAELAAVAAQVASDNDEEQPTRWRPASWMLSTVAHVVVIVVLASMSLAVSPPKDQLAFSGSATESDEAVIENFQIETSEPLAPSDPTEAETAYDVSELGTLPVTEVNVDLPAMTVPDNEMFTDLTSSSAQMTSMMKSLKSDQGPKTQFCGVDGGGKHFVYLVDSSNSMGSGFQSARAELLASIDQLKPDQRFYVVFFDEQPDYMRVSDPNTDDDASVMATPENKKRLRTWAMNVEMNKGKAPYDVLPFVLKLRPDVIFLLSDGEFPDKIGQILREQNRQENLFGDSGPISIVHTIRYHGREGEEGRRAEATMVAIAKENSGQYRHVPKPKSN